MSTLGKLYVELLRRGLTVMQLAARENDLDWLKSEVDFLHNIPSLIEEANESRHRYFWDVERVRYLECIQKLPENPDSDRESTFALYGEILTRIGKEIRDMDTRDKNESRESL